jgi:transposase
MLITLALLLDIPQVRVLSSRIEEDDTLLIEVESTLTTTQCHRCGREVEVFHGVDRPIRLQHLPVFGRKVFIEIRPKRYRCPYCEEGPTTTQRCAWYDPNRPHTNAFEQWVLKSLVHSTVADVSRQLDLGVKAVAGIIDHHVAPRVNWADFTALETLGIDEVALCKGQGHYVAVVWARDAQGYTHVLTVLPNRLQATVQAFLESIPADLKITVRRVCMDMWEGYAGAVTVVLPHAQIVVDRFHVAVQYRKVVDEVRKQECRRINADRPADQALPIAELRRVLHLEWPSLNLAQQGQLAELFAQAPTLASAYTLRTVVTAIFEGTPDRATAQTRIQLWTDQVKAAGIPCFDGFINTLHHWQDGILNYFEGRHNSGFVEGLNNKLQLLKRRCFGLDDPVTVFQRLWLDIEGARLWL